MDKESFTQLKASALQSTLYFAGATYVIYTLNLLQNIFLARFLVPEDIGIYSLAYFLLTLFSLLKYWGFSSAVIHSKEPVEKILPTHLFLETLTGMMSFVLVLMGCQTFLKSGYTEKLLLVLTCLALFSLFESFSLPSRALLEKTMQFNKFTRILVTKSMVNFAVSVYFAWRGFGVWSIVIGYAADFMYLFFGLWRARVWKVRFGFDKKLIRFFFQFGFPLWVGAVMGFISFQFDDFLVGMVISTKVLGYYAIAYELSKLPSALVSAVATRVAMPLYAKLQDNKEQLVYTYNLILKFTLFGTVPLALIGFFTAREAVVLVLGEKWLPAVPLYRGLILYSLCRPFIENTGGFFTATGKPQIAGKVMTLQALFLLVSGFVCTFYFGVLGTVACVNIMAFLAVLYQLFYLRGIISLPLKLVLAQLFSFPVSFLISFMVEHIIPSHLFLFLALKSLLILAFYFATLFLVDRSFFGSLRKLFSMHVN